MAESLTWQGVVQYFDTTQGTISKRTKSGRLPFIRVNGKQYFSVDDCDKIFLRRKQAQAVEALSVQSAQPTTQPIGDIVRDPVAEREMRMHSIPDPFKRAHPIARPLERITPDKRVILVGNDEALSLEEATRVLKQEDAIKRQLANLEREGSLVDREKFESAVATSLQELFPSLVSTLQGLVDSWGVRLCLPPVEQETIKQDFCSAVLRTWESVKQKIDKAAKI